MNMVKSIAAAMLVMALAITALLPQTAEAATDWDGGRIRAEGTGVAPAAPPSPTPIGSSPSRSKGSRSMPRPPSRT